MGFHITFHSRKKFKPEDTSSQTDNKAGPFLGIFVVVVALVFMGIPGTLGYFRLQLDLNGIETTGVISDTFSRKENKKIKGKTRRVTVHYAVVDFETQDGTKISDDLRIGDNFSKALEADQQVRVKYLPRDPNHFRLPDYTNPVWMLYAILGVFSAIGIALLVVGVKVLARNIFTPAKTNSHAQYETPQSNNTSSFEAAKVERQESSVFSDKS